MEKIITESYQYSINKEHQDAFPILNKYLQQGYVIKHIFHDFVEIDKHKVMLTAVLHKG